MSTAATTSTALTATAAPHVRQLDDEHPSVPFHFLTKESAIEKIRQFTRLAQRSEKPTEDIATMIASYCFPFTEKSHPIPEGNIHYPRKIIWEKLGLRMMHIDITKEASTSGIKKRVIVSLSPTALIAKPNGKWKEVATTAGLVMERATAARLTRWSSKSLRAAIAVIKNVPITEISTIALGEDLLPSSLSGHSDINIMSEMVTKQGEGKDEPLVPAPETAIAMIIHYCVTEKWVFEEIVDGEPVQRSVITSSKVKRSCITLEGVVKGPGRGLCVSLRVIFSSSAGALRKFPFRPLTPGPLALK